MAMIPIAELRRLGETQELEFKRSLSLMKEGLTTLCGMVNATAAKGTVVFGIDPSGDVVGLGDENLDSAQRTLAQHGRQKLDPPLALDIRAFLCEGKPILILSAQRSRAIPFHEYGGRAYIREGSSTRQLSVLEKQSLSVLRNRDLHNGPWICDQCGAYAGTISCVEVTSAGPRKTYRHSCGGEWWPATQPISPIEGQ
ncbi:MAG: ATP-binding protein [Phycisphaerae bacterium]|nr:ATP-binding protein [Phycisphaerae bacterium]